MPRFPARLRWPALVLALVAGAAGVATAAIELGDATIVMKLQLYNEDGVLAAPTADDDKRFMNRANCECGEAATFGIEFTLTGTLPSPPPTDNVDFWVGTSCDDADRSIRDLQCERLEGFTDVTELQNAPQRTLTVRQLIATTIPADEPCPTNVATDRFVYSLIDPGDDGIGEGDYKAEPYAIYSDTQPPPEVDDVVAHGGERAVVVSWTLPEAIDDLEYFQLLCQRADQTSDEADGFPRLEPHYLTPRMVDGCNVSTAIDAEFHALANPDAPVASDELLRLDPEFLCGEAGGTATSIRVEGLENGVAYHVVLVAADLARNSTAIDVGEVKPKPARDFWEDYGESGGTAEHGCQAGGGSPGWLGILAIAGLVGVGRRRRRRAIALGGVVGLVGLLVVARVAGAQPYLDEEAPEPGDDVGRSPVDWNLDLKLGPYLPAIDDSVPTAPGEQGPFERMFGDGPFLLGQVTLDRFFVHRFGLLGVTASIGYLATSARAWEEDENGEIATYEDGVPKRSEGDFTGFRMLPTSLGVAYRFGVLDNLYGIPLVPYARLGLSYYIWWSTQPNGDLARKASERCDPPREGCKGDRALGASLGWQGTLGLAVRAERLDPDAASAMRNELGIAHAGFFAELTKASVDGFGDEKKLPLGAVSWSAGIDFEF